MNYSTPKVTIDLAEYLVYIKLVESIDRLQNAPRYIELGPDKLVITATKIDRFPLDASPTKVFGLSLSQVI